MKDSAGERNLKTQNYLKTILLFQLLNVIDEAIQALSSDLAKSDINRNVPEILATES